MSSQPTDRSPASTLEPRGARSLLIVLSLAMALVFFAAAIPAPIRAAWSEFSLKMQLQDAPQSALPAKLSDHEIEEIANLPAQQQAERLLERAVNQDTGALEQIGKSAGNWFGQLELQGQLSSLITTALNSITPIETQIDTAQTALSTAPTADVAGPRGGPGTRGRTRVCSSGGRRRRGNAARDAAG